ncbi:MAG: WG repeat-containing protein [Cyanobacteria bacterium RUI128]|nr:WG repeat-containing protein [Cyanobacteria bacterium RUI128]
MRVFVLLLSICLFFGTNVSAIGAEEDSFDIPEVYEENVIDANTLDENNQPLVRVYQSKTKFGLEKSDGTKITKPIYKKVVRLGDKSWIVQYRNKFGLIDYNGDYIIFPRYRNVRRLLNRYVMFGNDNDYGLYDENGFTIIQPEYSSIDLMYGKMFLTSKNFRYGIVDLDGNTLLENEFEDIYMPQPSVMMVQYEGRWCKIESVSEKEITLPADINAIKEDKDFRMTNLMVNTGVGAGYSVLTVTDYALKLLSSLSPAYEATIDELMYSQGADTISILMRLSWLPKFPVVFAKQYYRNMRRPNSGPLAKTRNSLRKQLR